MNGNTLSTLSSIRDGAASCVLILLLTAVAFIVTSTSASAIDQQRALFGSDWQGGALLAHNADYDDQYVVALWAENLSPAPPYQARVLTSYSHDAGLTWAPPQELWLHVLGTWANSSTSDFAQRAADVVMDENGVVHLVMIFGIWRSDGTEDSRSEVLYGQVDPVQGLLLNQYMLAEEEMDANHPRFNQVALALGAEAPDPQNRYLHVLFGHDTALGNDSAEMLYARSADGGITFSPPVDINWHSGLDNPTSCDMTADRNGNVYVAYGPSWYSTDEPAAIHFTRSSDNGITWSSGTNQTGNGGSPALLCDESGGVYCFCNAAGMVGYQFSSDFGTTWSTEAMAVPRNYGGHFASPRIQAAWAETGIMHVTFSDRVVPDNSSPFEIFYFRMRTDGSMDIPRSQMSVTATDGNNWDFSRSLVSLGAEDFLVGCSQRFSWDWGVTAFGKPYTMKINYQVTAAPEPVVTSTELPTMLWPNPTRTGANVSYRLERTEPVMVDVLDVNGRRIRELFQGEQAEGIHVAHWDGRDDGRAIAPAGVYFLRVQTAREAWSEKVVIRR